MSWALLLEVIEAEAGPEVRDRIEGRCKRELQGVRCTIPASDRPRPTDHEIDKALRQVGYHIGKAADLLGVAPSTVYRILNAKLASPKAPERRITR